MKTNENSPKEIQDVIQGNPLLKAAETGIMEKVGKHVKKLIFITSLGGLAFIVQSCVPAYVEIEPTTTVEFVRPARPSNVHIWIEGGWVYSSRSHSYVQRNGHWDRPRQGRTYVPGNWESTPRGHKWKQGQWQKEGHGNGNGHGNGKGNRRHR